MYFISLNVLIHFFPLTYETHSFKNMKKHKQQSYNTTTFLICFTFFKAKDLKVRFKEKPFEIETWLIFISCLHDSQLSLGRIKSRPTINIKTRKTPMFVELARLAIMFLIGLGSSWLLSAHLFWAGGVCGGYGRLLEYTSACVTMRCAMRK